MYTTSSVFLKTLAEAGITHAFVNWGSDHPALLEDLERQRQENGHGTTKPKIVTCPNEMVALSSAQAYAQVTGKPACVIVHVDVGTLALGGALANCDRGRTPVLIYAGASPFSLYGEHKGSRNEWIMGIQDIPDQTAIVRQYMRHTAQICSGTTVDQTVKRALQIATSQPPGPVYLWARREVMEEVVDPMLIELAGADLPTWPSVEPSALSSSAVSRITTALVSAECPLLITSHLGRNPEAVAPLLALSTLLAIPIVCTCPSAVSVPTSHRYYLGTSFLFPGSHTPLLPKADVIVVLDSYVPWIPINDAPPDDARVFIIDGGDPLNRSFGTWHIDAELISHAEPELALGQIVEEVRLTETRGGAVGESIVKNSAIAKRAEKITALHDEMIRGLDDAEAHFVESPSPNENNAVERKPTITVPNVVGAMRRAIESLTPSKGAGTLILNESISNYPTVWAHARAEQPGAMFSSGGSSLGWGIGGAVGAVIGAEIASGTRQEEGNGGREYDCVVSLVGDGSFVFGVPSAVYWMSRRYKTPFLTIILNNGGWKSPKLSLLGVHPSGLGAPKSGDHLSVGFGPDTPDYSQIAVAASDGWVWGRRVGVDCKGREELEEVLKEAVRVVVEERRAAVVDCVLERI